MFLTHAVGQGGAERGLLELAAALQGRGVQVRVLASGEGPLTLALEEAGVATRVVAFGRWARSEHRSPRRVLAIPKHLRAARRVAVVLRELRPDVVITNTITVPAGALAARIVGVPHVWYIREFGEADHRLRFSLGFRNSVRLVSALSSLVVVNCGVLRDYFAAWVPAEKLRVVYNAVELGVSPERLDAWRDGRKGLPGALRCVFVARLSPTKGQEDAIRALALLTRKGLDVRLTLVGGGSAFDTARVRALCAELGVSDFVELVGQVDEPLRYFCQADVALVCSRREAFGRATIEAMKTGLPVVGSDVGGPSEHVRDGWNGLLYTPGEPKQLASLIERLAREPGLRERLARNAAAWSRGAFNAERQTGEVLRVISEVSRTGH